MNLTVDWKMAEAMFLRKQFSDLEQKVSRQITFQTDKIKNQTILEAKKAKSKLAQETSALKNAFAQNIGQIRTQLTKVCVCIYIYNKTFLFS